MIRAFQFILRSHPIRRSALLALLALSAGCAGPPPPSQPLPQGPVGLKPGDAIRVSIWQEPDLTGEFMVAQNGKVVFPLLGERDVLEMPLEEVESRLSADYREYLENPSVEVMVLRRIAILGEVRQPSLYMADPTVTLTEALALAGGVSPVGNKNDIRLVRGDRVLVQSMEGNQIIGAAAIQSGDQIVVGQQSWARRNATFITAGVGAATSIVVALIIAGSR